MVLGLNSLEDYIRHSPYFGAIAGRYGNRIGEGRFRLGDRVHQLSLNDGRNSLHGGARGFSHQPWQLAASDSSSAALTLLSPDGDQGYPGNLTVSCIYRLVGATLRVELTAATDAETPVNLCQHSYFNLDGSPSILDHNLHLAADFYTPTDAELIPTGEVRAVAGTPYDFRASRPVRFADEPGQPSRYDINFVLRRDRLAPSGMDGCMSGPCRDAGLGDERRRHGGVDDRARPAVLRRLDDRRAGRRARRAVPTAPMRASASNPSIFPTAPTGLTSPPRS